MDINQFTIRPFKSLDIDELIKLFYNTVRNIDDLCYTKEQREAWAPKEIDKNLWEKELSKDITYVVEHNLNKKIIVGFGQMTHEGYLDKLYVHKDYQRKGIASLIYKTLEEKSQALGLKEITTESSITALPFFKKHGFIIIGKKDKVRHCVTLVSYKMKKNLYSA